ncbi:MAG: Rpn family recombination-promoting nuclease/putative transposase [Treponema sp.]|nr:Rpn family recombination-promoting nuclease/putative transposase [Treponema sp.]
MKKQKLYKRLNLLNDFLFYMIMGEKGDEVQLLGFLNAVLGKTGEDRFTAVEIIENKYLSPEVIGNKSSILDVRAVLQGKTRVNIEVQVRNQHNMDRRSLFYWSREYLKSLKKGKDYKELPDVIAINIVDFNFPPARNSHTRFHLREDIEHDLILTDALEIHFLNMVQYRKQRKKILLDDPLNRWLVWLDVGSPPELIEEVVKMDSAIYAANERMVYVTGDEEAIRAYEMRQMALSDYNSEMNYAHEEGHAKGLAEGLAEKALEIAHKMKEMGFLAEQIQAATGLTVETIEQV